MYRRHKWATLGYTHFRIDVIIAPLDQPDSLDLLFGSQAKNPEGDTEIVVNLVDGIDNAKALDSPKRVPSEVLDNSLAAAHNLTLRGSGSCLLIMWALGLGVLGLVFFACFHPCNVPVRLCPLVKLIQIPHVFAPHLAPNTGNGLREHVRA